MSKPAKNIRKIIKNRIDFYASVSTEENVKIEAFEVFTHKQTEDRIYFHLRYQILENGEFFRMEEIETFTDDGGWVCLFNQKDLKTLQQFLAEKIKSNFDCTNVKLEKHECQEKI